MILRMERKHSNGVIKRNIMVLENNDTANSKQRSERHEVASQNRTFFSKFKYYIGVSD